MTNKNLLQAMGRIAPELIADAAPDILPNAVTDTPVRKTRRPWLKFGAAAAACLVAVAGVGIGIRMSNGARSSVLKTAQSKKMLLAAAIYPEMPDYPDVNDYIDDWDAFHDANIKWQEARRALTDQPEGYTDGFDVFFSDSARVFLSDAGNDNIVYSPLSLYMALGMSAEITDGNTRQQILDALAQDDIKTLRSHARSIWQANYIDDGIAKCVLATSLWMNNKLTYNKNTVDTLASNYYSSVFTGDPGSEEYNKLLREWLNEQTDGLLEDYVSGVEMPPETVLALAATVNYSGKWDSKFLKEYNEQGVFHTPNGDVQCEFMNKSSTTDYFWGDKFSSVTLDLEENGQMRLILPDEDISAEELWNDKEAMDYMLMGKDTEYTKCEHVLVDLSVPKFDVSSKIDLEDGLHELGITDIFDSAKSDFTLLTDSVDAVRLDKAEQAARVVIDEEGCKAAAYTFILNAGGALPTEKVDFVLDRPFIFEIISATGLPLFVGIINNPVQ